MSTQTLSENLNGVNLPRLHQLVQDIQRDPANAMTSWNVTTRWVDGAKSESRVSSYRIGDKTVEKDFMIRIDEPLELAGSNTQANPQEYLLSAFNACMMVGYVALASLEGIQLESVEIESKGDIDLRGFLGLASDVKPGYDQIQYTVRIKGHGTAEQFEKIHQIVMATSPNRFNIANPIKLTSDLRIG